MSDKNAGWPELLGLLIFCAFALGLLYGVVRFIKFAWND